MPQIRDRPPNDIVLGLDLGQAADFTALSVTEVQTDFARRTERYAVRSLDRWLPHRYQDVVERVAALIPRLAVGVLVDPLNGAGVRVMRPNVSLVLDRTGVGRAVGDLFSAANLPVALQLISITGGADVARDPDGSGWRVPKRDLVGVVAVALQNGTLEFAEGMEHAATLRAELRNFRARISAAGHTSYGAGGGGDDWRQGSHDDLVLSVALSLWWGERKTSRGGEATAESYANVGGQDRADAIDALWEAEWPTPYSRR